MAPGESASVTLAPSGEHSNGAKAVAIFPGLSQTNAPGQEFFLIENRTRIGNDGGNAKYAS